ncbi:MAG TPA: hypothetical protein VL307_07985 [Chitinophagaceae bacterium]|nr:hypothetical protein [Chitinophagaceae bacterium]
MLQLLHNAFYPFTCPSMTIEQFANGNYSHQPLPIPVSGKSLGKNIIRFVHPYHVLV